MVSESTGTVLKSLASGRNTTLSGEVGLCPVNTSMGLKLARRRDGVLLMTKLASGSSSTHASC